ncbi:MAG: LTA synthase family protein [Coriobacteriia bacterium]|nr:LTA synthase family protein [Coriobacteriia bacterium]
MLRERLRALDALPLLVALLLGMKVLWSRHLVIGHALGTGFLADLVFLAVIWAFASSVRGRPGRIAIALVALFSSVVLLGSVMYASYFEQPPEAAMLLMAGQVRLGEDVLGLLTLKGALLLADLPFVFWAAFRPARGKVLQQRATLAFGVASLHMAIVLTIVTAVVGTGKDPLTVAYRFGLFSFESASVLGRSLGGDGDGLAFRGDLQSQIDRLTGHSDGPRMPNAPEFGQYEGKNVILIQMEALQAGLIGARIDGQAIVPRLEAFIGRSHYFPNTYSQIGGGNTADAEFVVNTSLLPPTGQPASVAYARKEIPGLPRMLEERGYTTATFHTNTADFWNRFQLYPALGFGAYCDRVFFGDDDITGYGPSDRVLYEKTLPVLVSELTQENRFYASLVTLSAHYPFRSIQGRSPLKLSEDVAKTTTGRYLEAQAYADEQLGWFLDRLETHGLLDECIVVIYGDHFGMRWADETDEDAAIRKHLYGRAYNRADFYNIPLVIHLPGQDRPFVHDTVLGQVDVMPTVADLLGLDLAGVPHFGRSAFVDTQTLLTRPGALPVSIDGTLLYIRGVDGKEDRFYLSKTQEKLYITQHPPEGFENAVKQLSLCDEYVLGLADRAGASKKVGYIPKPGPDFR